MKKPKILVGSPTYYMKDYIFNKWYQIITNLSYDNYDWIVVDNSPNVSYKNKLRRRGVRRLYRTPRGKNSREAQANSMELMRHKALKEDYDFMLIVETDLLPPRDIIEKLLNDYQELLDNNKINEDVGGVVGASYEIGLHGSKVAPRRMCIYGYEPDQTKTGGKVLNMVPIDMGYKMLGTGLQKVTACGIGCTLIPKQIFKKFDFPWTDVIVVHTDMLFYRDLFNKGIPVYCDTNIIVPHYNMNWAKVKDM